jgi:hypothetical protein
MIDVTEDAVITFTEKRLEPLFALGEWKRAKIFTAIKQQIEGEIDQILRSASESAACSAAKFGAPL